MNNSTIKKDCSEHSFFLRSPTNIPPEYIDYIYFKQITLQLKLFFFFVTNEFINLLNDVYKQLRRKKTILYIIEFFNYFT